MPEARVNGIRVHYEEEGEGAPILCIHGTGSSAVAWRGALSALAERGRVIAYDRRGGGRTERPGGYERTSVSEHASDAAALLAHLSKDPAILIGRSYGGSVAVAVALRHPDRVRSLVLLEPGDIQGVSPPMDDWTAALYEDIRRAADERGVDGAAPSLIDGALGEGAWESLPPDLRRIFISNAPAILAEANGEQLRLRPADLSRIAHPTLVVAAEDSPPAFRDLCEVLTDMIPDAQSAIAPGGHLIDPAGPRILEFIDRLPEPS
jgi:pimeloyl-ACP methyl ester carboxylesterase